MPCALGNPPRLSCSATPTTDRRRGSYGPRAAFPRTSSSPQARGRRPVSRRPLGAGQRTSHCCTRARTTQPAIAPRGRSLRWHPDRGAVRLTAPSSISQKRLDGMPRNVTGAMPLQPLLTLKLNAIPLSLETTMVEVPWVVFSIVTESVSVDVPIPTSTMVG